MTRPARMTARSVESAIVHRLETHGEQSARQLAEWMREPVDRVRRSLMILEAQQRIVARLETHEEAVARMRATPRSILQRHVARRVIVYLVEQADAQDVAA